MRRVNLLYLAGMLVIALGLMGVPSAGWAAYGDYLSTISTGSLNQPSKVAVDQANGDVYVTDSGNKVVKKFDYTGAYVSSFSLAVSGTPVGIAVNSSNIFVGDTTNKCVWIYNKSGALTDLGGTGTSHKLGGIAGTSLRMPNTVTLAPSGHIFVVDGDSDKVYIYNADGSANSSFGTSGNTLSSTTTIRMYYPSGLTMANSTGTGTITQYFYIGDQGNSRVQKLSYTYDSVTKAITAPTYVQTIGTLDASYSAKGDDFNKFLRVSDVTWSTTKSSSNPTAPGSLYVTDSLQMVVQRFENDAVVGTGAAFNYSGGAVSSPSNLNIPTGAAVDVLNQKLYVVNNQGPNIAVYTIQNGTSPSLTVDNPTSLNTPVTASPYVVNYTAGDPDSTATVYLFLDTNTTWNGGSKSITPGTGEYLIGSNSVAQGAPAAGSINWNAISAAPGTYYIRGIAVDPDGNSSEAYSTGTVVITGSGDGLNDIFKATYPCVVGASDDPDGDGLTNLQEQTLGTNPCVADTDGGGVNDGVEVAMGTNPNSAADDLTSTPILVGPYFNVNWAAKWKTWFAFKNTDASNASYLDVTFYNSSGGAALTTKHFTIPANGVVRVDPYAYTEVTNITKKGSIEARSAGGRLLGYSTQEKWNPTIATKLDYCYSCELAPPAAADTTVYGSFWNVNPTIWDTWYSVKNMSNNQVTITASLYDTAGNAIGTPTPYICPAKSVTAFTPSSIINPVTYKKGNLKVAVTSGSGNILGYQAQYYLSASGGGNIDYGYTELMGTPATLMSSVSAVHWSNASGSRATWLTLYNPGATAATATFDYYDAAGNHLGQTPYTVNPRANANVSPSLETYCNGIPEGSMEITVTGGQIFGYDCEYWINQMTSTVNDASIAENLTPLANPANTLYAPYIRKNNDGFDTVIVLKNANSNPVTANLYFYDTNGTQIATDIQTVPAKASITLNTQSYSFTQTEGSLKVLATGGGLMGYFANIRNDVANPNSNATPKYEGSFGGNLMY